MRILVTGGTGVIGAGVLPEILKLGHEVRLLSRHASQDARRYPDGVTAFNANITDPQKLRGAADNCDAIVHIAGIAEETPPDVTFEKVNVAGTQALLTEAERAGVRRLVYVSSLGADRGQSEYHKSKLRAEQVVRASKLNWVILRPGNVYGPGDEVISLLLKLVRTSPVVPVVGSGDQRFQPIWFEDLGQAIAKVATTQDYARQTLELAGGEITTTREIVDQLKQLTDRNAAAINIPKGVVATAARLAEGSGAVSKLLDKAGVTMPITTSKLQMLIEENFITANKPNGLVTTLGIQPTDLRIGLARLADELPELLPEEGVGAMERKTFRATISGARMNAAELMQQMRDRISEIMPLEFESEPGAADHVEPNATLTGAIPGRGHFQVRAADVSDQELTFLTVEGHPLAGMVTLRARPDSANKIVAEVETHARASNLFDWLALRAGGDWMQNRNWRGVIENIVKLSGGTSTSIETHSEKLSDDAAAAAEKRAQQLATTSNREAFAEKISH